MLSAEDAPTREFHGLEWRLVVPVARRSHPSVDSATAPLFHLKWELVQPPSGVAAPGAATPEEEWVTTDFEGLLRLRAVLQQAIDAMHDAPYRRLQRLVK